MNDVIRIGTRNSTLALWQANHAKRKFEKLNIPTKIVPIKSEGDFAAAEALVEGYGVKVNQQIHSEVLKRNKILRILVLKV